jgi:hypothetical protein
MDFDELGEARSISFALRIAPKANWPSSTKGRPQVAGDWEEPKATSDRRIN